MDAIKRITNRLKKVEAMSRNTLTYLIATGLCLLTFSLNLHAQQPENTEPQYDPKGAQGCLKCHDKGPVLDVLRTPHALSADSRTPFGEHACETCHGASPDHLLKPAEGEKRISPPITFTSNSKNTPSEQNEVCLKCHSGGGQMNWQGSAHHFAEVACSSCHQVHVRKDPTLLKQQQAEVCFECHVEQRAQSHLPSRHPVLDGQVLCADCHNAHGSPTDMALKGLNINDTCYRCHAEKRGPFLWEHQPVSEDCTICHVSHGSVNRGLLKTRAPFLCQQCHMAEFHSSRLQDGGGLSNVIGQRELLGRSCMNCHSQVHGSNHPSGVRGLR
jgi:DmsE family decaheme c-type cytochrome